ncbi:MAG: CoA pyrophosphatase [Bacteroidetes bacterium]|nr:CoA pyrophosphatase [Bacteroidota bacterium]
MNWPDFLRNAINNELPGENAHLEMSPLYRIKSSLAKQGATSYRESAVAIHLASIQDELQILLTQRSIYDGVHSGQISFPGGKVEHGDFDEVFTARRESFEETGIPIESGEHLGKLTDVFIPVSGFNVQPHVFYHSSQLLSFKRDPREVSEIFWFPVNELVKPTTKSEESILLSNGSKLDNIPCFRFKEKVIWGATAIILNEFKEIVIRQRNI